jgi:hypothetical protein
MSRSRPRMELSEFVARSVAVVFYDVIVVPRARAAPERAGAMFPGSRPAIGKSHNTSGPAT